ncbi:restriction endonuclease [Neptuniibacter sp. QD48_55]|uniref:restriction endonuclease n=1 Tax=Neptuniibacter sp. QD48_55 TaxID=3398212 RepID=UPI0039F46D72
MSRRGRTTLFEDLIDLASILPYWVSLLIAVVAYVGFHYYAISEIQPVANSATVMAQHMTGTLLRGIASFLQYVIPAAFVLGALLSGIKSFQARTQARRYQQWSAPSSTVPSPRPAKGRHQPKPTDDISWQQFELLVGEAFRQKGFSVLHGGDKGPDGGVDVRLTKDGKRYLVQCKHWKTKRVGVTVIRELYGVMVSSGVAGGYVVTSGECTEEALSFSDGKPIKLINGEGLARMLGRELEVSSEGIPKDRFEPSAVKCPKCGSDMVKRVAKRGQNAGNEFWGCSRFPKCRSVMDL